MSKAINFTVSAELHTKLKLKTVKEGTTIKQYIINLIEKDLKNESEEN